MAIDFPASPTNGQTHTVGSTTWTWDGTKWSITSGAAGATDNISEGNTSAEVIDTGSDGRFVVTTEGTEALRVDASRRLLVGTSTSASAAGPQYARLQVVGNTLNETSLLSLQRSETFGNITSGEDLGVVIFADNTGNTFAQISGTCDGTTGSGDYPGRLSFSTTADGASSPTARLTIKADGAFRDATGVYLDATGSAANMVISSAGAIQRSTSSAKYKTDIETLEDQYSDALLNCRPVWYRSTTSADNPEWGWWGFIAEEVAEIDPRLVHWKTTEPVIQEDGSLQHVPCEPEPEGVQYERFVPHLLNLIKRQQQAIETLEAKVAALESA